MTEGSARRRRRPHRQRAFVAVDVHDGTTVADLLADHGDRAEVLFLVGDRPGRTSDGFRAWLRALDGTGWSEADRGHHLSNVGRPVLHYVRDADGRTVEVHRAASWFGEAEDDGYRAADVGDAFGILLDAIRSRWDDGAALLTTPATTGRDLWLRSLPFADEHPPLSAELADLIRSTSGQGRFQLFDHGDVALPGLYGYDARFGYAACLWGLGVGEPTHDDRPAFDPYQRGRYRVRFTVPGDWSHVGLLPVPGDHGTWLYPDEPGSVWTTWADGAELLVAQRFGWSFDVLERIVWPRAGKPLDAWGTALVKLREQLAQRYVAEGRPLAVKLAADGLRMILLAGLGAFHTRAHEVTRSVPLAEAATATGVTAARVVGDRLEWVERQSSPWDATRHPEWSAAVWARQRARLLHHKASGTGALTLPASHLVAFRLDAIYTTHPTGWSDSGQVGALRLTHRVERPVPAPRTTAELLEARR